MKIFFEVVIKEGYLNVWLFTNNIPRQNTSFAPTPTFSCLPDKKQSLFTILEMCLLYLDSSFSTFVTRLVYFKTLKVKN